MGLPSNSCAEPYKDRATGMHFGDLMTDLRKSLPSCEFGLVTNGTIFVDPGWFSQFKWIRFSIDAASPEGYMRFRGRDFFELVCKNLITLLSTTSVQQVNVGFVYCGDNIREAPDAAQYFFDLVQRCCPNALSRINIDYRPLRRDPKDADRQFPPPVSACEIESALGRFRLLAEKPAFRGFLRAQTNCEAVASGNRHEEVEFERCGYSTIFRLIRANGDVRPCCMRLAEPEFHLGNILRDDLKTIALNALYNAAYLRPGCDAAGCKLARLNFTLDQGITNTVPPSRARRIAENQFFG